MKHLFSITLRHEYKGETSDTNHSTDLDIRGLNDVVNLISTNQLAIVSNTGGISCFVDEDLLNLENIDTLRFWVIVLDNNFYNYTAFPEDFNATTPYYHWFNIDSSDELMVQKLEQNPIESPPQIAMGLISIDVSKVAFNSSFKFTFEVMKTIWRYHIVPKPEQKDWEYMILDKEVEFQFKETERSDDAIVIESTAPIPYFKKATDRFLLVWSDANVNEDSPHKLTLPFANYEFRLIGSEIETTPIYLYI